MKMKFVRTAIQRVQTLRILTVQLKYELSNIAVINSHKFKEFFLDNDSLEKISEKLKLIINSYGTVFKLAS